VPSELARPEAHVQDIHPVGGRLVDGRDDVVGISAGEKTL
jgi:hypothetical protein